MRNRPRLSPLIVSYFVAILAVFTYRHIQSRKMSYPEVNKYYIVQLEKYTENLQLKFTQLLSDESTKSFIDWSASRSSSFLLQIFYGISAPLLKMFTTKTATNGILYRGEMFVISQSHFRQLIGEENKYDSWLDLGAGDGGALERLGVKDMANHIWTTEICAVMRKRLEWRGFGVKDVENWDDQTYDVISMLNLLDRAGDPDLFLQKANRVLNSDGILLIAVVLPFNPYVERGGINNKPLKDISEFKSTSKMHSDQLDAFISAVENRGFKLERWSCVPYLCEGDQTTTYYTLRDTILIFRKKA